MLSAEQAGRERRSGLPPVSGAEPGVYLQFESFPDLAMAVQSLDPRNGKRRPELINVTDVAGDEGVVQQATVFVPDGMLSRFVRKVESYSETLDRAKPKQAAFVDGISTVRLATLRALWTDDPTSFPDSETVVWWEVWLRRREGEVDRLAEFAGRSSCLIGASRLAFTDRVVVLLRGSAVQLSTALDVLDDLAELRRPHEPASVLAGVDSAEQAEWVAQLAERLTSPSPTAPAVCLLDTGVHRTHPLLEPAVAPEDAHACDPAWLAHDHDGHGTEMAGLALYGDIGAALLAGDPIALPHAIESVKILPPRGDNPPELYGALTSTATSMVEILAPARARAFAMAVTATANGPTDPARQGQPTSWSAAVDALAAGRGIDTSTRGLVYLDDGDDPTPRLLVVSAGNVRDPETEHLVRSDLEPVEDPSQAWNALTVGAYTELDDLGADPSRTGWSALAPRGELSPHSRTSVGFAAGWPVKPDVVVEGGNLARAPNGDLDHADVLCLLTTKAPLRDQRLLTATGGTSPATAQAAHLAARVMAAYPELWPETVRALIVHSARWTEPMRRQIEAATTKKPRDALRRRYGMGVPDVARALRSASDSLTMIAQDSIHPYDGAGRTREMHLHDLPWPSESLAGLGDAPVDLRVTLSYFVEPNPARRGWAQRFRYQSHGLRFDLRRATESTDDFRKRLNDKALDEDERRPAAGGSDAAQWMFGERLRATGSVTTDIWRGPAIELARRGLLGVYPVTGWWKENASRDRSDRGARYALVVSIDAPDQDVDIWSEVAAQIGVPVDVSV
ncbi:MAG: S8 family peptidase [Kineosporiaceae bacterium]